MKFWDKILNSGVLDFLNLNQAEIKSYYINLNFDKEENIGFSLLINNLHLVEVTKKIEDHFEEFFSAIINNGNVNFSITQSFEDRLQFSLRFNDYAGDDCNNELHLRKSISLLMIQGLNIEGVGLDDILTFSFYLYLSLSNVLFQKIKNGMREKVLKLDSRVNFNCLPDTGMITELIQNYSLIHEIAEDIVNKRSTDGEEIEWLKEWEILCTSELDKKFKGASIQSIKAPAILNNFLNEILNIVDHHLGLSKKTSHVMSLITKNILGHVYLKKSINNLNSLLTIGEQSPKNHILKIKQTKHIIKRIDTKDIPKAPSEIRLFTIARNEEARLPYFLKYYKKLGVDRIFIINNDSEDNTPKIALNCPIAHLFEINESYQNHWDWMEYMLETYGKNQWCIVVDIDELFSYPFYEKIKLRGLINYLESNKYTAISSVLLDMHSSKPLNKTFYKSGENPLKFCKYFNPGFKTKDYQFFDKKNNEVFVSKGYTGGIRHEIFGNINNYDGLVCLTKISLFKKNAKMYLVQGMHAMNNAKFSDLQGAVFHTKFLNDFIERAFEESRREEHFNKASEYKVYKSVLEINNNITLHTENSLKFKNSSQLIDLGIMNVSKEFLKYFNINH